MNTQTAPGIERDNSAQSHHPNPHKRIQAATVREMCGGISDMSLWRWLNDPDVNFPKPIYIGRRRYWKEAEIIAWLEAREVAA